MRMNLDARTEKTSPARRDLTRLQSNGSARAGRGVGADYSVQRSRYTEIGVEL